MSEETKNGTAATSRWAYAIPVLIAALLGGGGLAWRLWGRSGSEEEAVPFFEVAEGPLTINVVEAGTVQPREQVILKNEVEGTTTILYLIPEGTQVKEGDLLVQLDKSGLEDAKVDQEIKVQNAESLFVQARENLEVMKNKAQSDVDQAELDFKFAKQDLLKYKEGEYLNKVQEFEAQITLAEEELKRSQERLRWSEILYEEKYLSESELKADQLAESKADLDLKLAKSSRDLFLDYTHKRTLDELESNVRQAEMALERTVRNAKADVVQAEADLRAREAEYKRQKDKLDKIVEQIGKTDIFAPTDGLVVYATSARMSHPWRNVEPLDEGQQVREREELIYLPTANTFKAEIKIHESQLDKVNEGMPVRVTVDALPGKIFGGEVATIAPLPDPQSMFMNPDLKVYNTEVHIREGGDVLRTGMTCKVEVIIEKYDKAIYVPVQCVVRVEGRPTVYLMEDGEPVPRTVEIGLDNNHMVRILDGLRPGEEVLLAPPLQEGTAPLTEEPSPPAEEGEEEGSLEPVGQAGKGPSDMSEEQRQKMRERWEKMSPEEREALKAKFGAGSGEGQQGAQGRRGDGAGRRGGPRP